MRSIRLALAILTVLALLPHSDVNAQDFRYAEEPTGGVNLPSVGLAGENDATTTTVNPAGLGLLRGPHFAFALDLAREEGATRSGPGGGLYYASSLGGGGFVPKLGWGVALEWLRPSRAELRPDPGTPTRFTLSNSLALGANSALGLGWHHFFDDGALQGVDTFDLGWSARFGSHFAAGVVVRDLGAPSVAGETVNRRYEAELVSRPFGTDRLEVGLGTRIGENDADLAAGHAIDTWLKWSLRLTRGVYLRGQVGSESLRRVTTTATSTTSDFLRDDRLSVGLEFSFGGLGTTAYGTVVRDSDGDYRATGGTFVARLSKEEVPSLLPEERRMERLDLRGALGQRKLTGILGYLRRAAKDDKIVGLFINIDGLSGGWASLHEIREGILAVRKTGKKVFAFMVEADTRQYFVASAADKVYVDPAGGIRLQGFSGTSMYFAGLFEKIGVKAQFERIEEYKSAPESFTRTGPTEPAFRMRNELYDSIYGTLVADIAASRKISEKRVRTLIDNGPYTSGELQKLPDLVDGVVLADDLAPLLAREMGGYYPIGTRSDNRPERWQERKIAVVYLVGDIVGGKSRSVPVLGRTLAGGETIARAIAAANADDKIEAIVLRIDSPGGSALASEFMAREVKRVRGRKPIICSMGNLAASGGYFAAAYCDRIFADSMTITGSIGIFNGSFDISALLQKIGLSWTTYKRGENADLGSMYRQMSDGERKFMKQKLHYYYGRFIAAVAEGRGMTTEQVDNVGRGHVWTGKQGLRISLVDQLGGLVDAIDYAKAAAGFKEGERAQLVQLPKRSQSLLSKVLSGPLGSEVTNATSVDGTTKAYLQLLGFLPGTMGETLLHVIPGSVWSEPGVPQARLPFSILWDDQ